ncbi:MAG: hypothetical protein A3H02_01795 [Candidatus Niyogibacteria bacterium RIFCSPLOWO2_12_FULL_41_13]|uniref:Type 4 fimbrial biogenesis protein PilX N-terminal domain-containing protein n=1 Tax=Candidatus Niyogibacteria bacterium RIFCSPLOWO2_12_FULL_41_13 TaxID=1801726 RepID=A0A1G2F4T4_9BACT|nr:MAG: hypothetical protein A3H02_01795 [Candidatus Niyogibacteria bacterium RIFCSPLOWO2_12_FULL_41_13]
MFGINHNNHIRQTSNGVKNGFLLLLAVLIISIILSLGLGVGNVVLNQIKLSGAGEDSQIAFYAADAGAESALYRDLKQNEFPSGGSFILSLANGSCAEVSVTKAGSPVLTTIESRGRNRTSDPNQCLKIERAAERGISLSY